MIITYYTWMSTEEIPWLVRADLVSVWEISTIYTGTWLLAHQELNFTRGRFLICPVWNAGVFFTLGIKLRMEKRYIAFYCGKRIQ